MIISTQQVLQALKIYCSQPVAPRAGVTRRGAGDRDCVSISTDGRIWQVAKQSVDSAPAVRAQKVAELREAVRSGQYDPSGLEVAEKLIFRALVDKLV